jgi:hypothetical protein
LTGEQEPPQAATWLAEVVRDDRQTAHGAVGDDGVEERERRADEAESTDHHDGVVVHQRGGVLRADDLVADFGHRG